MNPIDTGKALDESVKAMKAAVAGNHSILMSHAKRAAIAINRASQQAGDSIAIRVTQHSDGVKISVTGNNAGRYKLLMGKAMDEAVKGAKVDIKARLVNRSAS